MRRCIGAILCLALSASASIAQQRAPQWHATLDRTITADDAGLGQIQQFFVTPSGEIVVLDGKDDQIKFIGPGSPKPSAVFGRNGEGPGEFRSLRWIGTSSGALWAEDVQLKRITWLDAAHKVAKTVREPTMLIDAKGDTIRFSIGFIQGIAPDGSLIVEALRSVSQPKPSWATDDQWEGMPYLRVDAEGHIKSVFAWVPGNACAPHVQASRGSTQFQIPFCAKALSTIATSGATIAVVAPDQAAHSYTVSSMNPTGGIIFSKRFSYTPVPIAAARFDSVLARTRTAFERMGASIPSYRRPDSYPPLDNLVIGRDGSLWLGEFLSGTTRVWHVLDRMGTLIGDLTLPGNVTVVVGERGQLWGIARGSDGDESIVHYMLTGSK